MSYSQQQSSISSSSGSSSLIEPLRSMAVASGTGAGGGSGPSGSSGIGTASSGIGGSTSSSAGGVGAGDKRAPIRVGFYDIEKTIGKGNFAVVKLARHRLTKTEVAIKIIDKTQLGAADLRRTYREVRVLKKLHHPHIIRLYQLMETKNMLYIVTEYAPQGEIFEHIARHGRLPEPVARRLYWQVVSAVDYCHKRAVVHRDLKAENLLLDMEGSVKLADFGFSTWWSPDSMLSTWCGSPPYAAPEVFEGRQYIGPEVDIWSLGVVLYVLVCGALPFDAATLPALRDRVLSARYRVPYFMSSECESLIRKMLVRDPARRYTIDQVKRHRWMQADGPPRLLPAPGHATIQPNSNSKQYLDGGLVPDAPTEPNEQILRLMASLGIDSSRTRESLRQQSYDHHAAIYFLLLERLRQHRPGSHRYTGSSSGGPPSAVRMMSTDSSTCRRTPRRPSTVAENAMRKMIPCPEAQQMLPHQTTALPGAAINQEQHAGQRQWKAHRASHCGPSQTSSVDEGVADLDSLWDPDQTGSVLGPGSSIGSVKRSQGDWKWPARGSTSSSVLLSTDLSLSQTSGSPRESVSGSGTTLSSWDSAWETGGLAAASLPSCSAASNVVVDERRSSITGPETPLSPTAPNLTSDRLWVPPPQHPTSPTEFRLGRRASDGFMGARRLIPFSKKLDGARAGGIAALNSAMVPSSETAQDSMNEEEEEGCVGEIPEPPVNFLCSPAKRPSLPDSWKLLPDNTWCSREPSTSSQWGGTVGEGSSTGASGSTSTQLHRQLMALRLHRRTGVVDPPDLNNLSEAANARRSVLRQQSYKLAQQQPVLPPPVQGFSLDSHNLMFRPIGDKESCLQAHEEEEEEEDEEDEETEERQRLRQQQPRSGSRPWLGTSTGEHEWSTLPVTMGDCKLTEINSTLRLSPLLNFSQFQQSPNPSPIPFHWDEKAGQVATVASTSVKVDGSETGTMQERMDTSGS